MKAQSNVPDQKLRWSVRRAAAEFAVGYHVLLRKLQEAGELAGEDGLFGTEQVVSALFGSLYKSRVRKVSADAQRSEMLAAELKGQLINRQALAEAFGQIADAMVRRITAASEVPRQVREDLLRELSEWPVALTSASDKGRRARSSGNGA